MLPTLRGIPWWGAIALATVVTALGAAIDASNNNGLGSIFKFCYLVGCLAAALLVRRRALFTAAVQPPLIAFAVGIITLYTLNAEQASSGLKSLIFQVLIPIANIFPWLAITFVLTLGIVLGRWYITRDAQPAAAESDDSDKDAAATKRRATKTSAARRATDRGTGSRSTTDRSTTDRSTTDRSATDRNATAARTARPTSARPTGSASGATATAERASSPTERAPRERAPREGDASRRSRSATDERRRSRKASADTPARRRPRPEEGSAAARSATAGRTTSGTRTGARATAGQIYRAEAGRPVEEIQPAEPATEVLGVNPTERR